MSELRSEVLKPRRNWLQPGLFTKLFTKLIMWAVKHAGANHKFGDPDQEVQTPPWAKETKKKNSKF